MANETLDNKENTVDPSASPAATSDAAESTKKREPADEKTIRAATHTTDDAPPQAPPHFDAAEARETIR